MRIKAVLALIVCLLLLCLSMGSAWAEKQIIMTFLGDCTLGGEDRLLYTSESYVNSFAGVAVREGYDYFFHNVKDLLAQDDITVANLECVLKDDENGRVDNKVYRFRGLTEYTQILSLGSVEAVNLENNHTDDYGQAGRNNTSRTLEAAGIGYFDRSEAYILEKDGIRIAFMAMWRGNYFYYGDDFVESIARVKESGVNAIVVSLHCGEEYSSYHNSGQASMAYRMIRAGADLIIGHHTHAVQGMEIYQDRMILYSLGNFVFGGNAVVRSLQTIMPRITFEFSDEGAFLGAQLRIYPAHVSGNDTDNNYQPLTVRGEQAEAVYALLDQDSMVSPAAPVLDAQTEAYRDYQWVFVTP